MSGASRPGRVALMVLLGLLAIFAEAAPLGHAADALPSPDLLFIIVAFFSVRGSGSLLGLAAFALGLVRDLLTDAPVGAGALTLFAASEALRWLGGTLRRSALAFELLAIAAALAGCLVVQWLVLVVTFMQPPAPEAIVRQWVLTVALYPAVALVLRWMFRIGWRRPGRS